MKKLGMIIAALLVSTGAAAAEITDAQLANLKIGATTYDQVLAELGKPTTVETASDGSRTLIYTSTKTHVKAATFLPVIGMFAGGAKGQTQVDQFEFDANGVLVKTSTSDTAVECKAYGSCR